MKEDGPVLCCPDKFRGSLTAREAAGAFAAGVERAGRTATLLPLADGGDGTLDVLCPSATDRRATRVTGPLGAPTQAEWGIRSDTAVVEMARASGLSLVDEANDPLRATTFGTGELIRAAVASGARRVIVGVGGSATVDGGLGALEALEFDLGGAEVVVACDVSTTFVDAARVFGPQKGAAGDAVDELERRLERLAHRYRRVRRRRPHASRVGCRGRPRGRPCGDRSDAPVGGGARRRGGRPTGGARDRVARDHRGGCFDATSLAGKVVGHVLREGRAVGTPVMVVAGDAERFDLNGEVPCLTLVELAGSPEAARHDAARLAADAAGALAARC